MVKQRPIAHLLLLLTLFQLSCNSEKDIVIDLPPFESELFVECYIEPGKPYRLALYGTVDYFEKPPLPDMPNALVIINHNGVNDTLHYNPYIDYSTGKAYNYISDDTTELITMDAGDYHLYIKDSPGRELTGTTAF